MHEKNVRQGHVSTLHIWPARRPLAACRAALIAALLADPGDGERREALLQRLGHADAGDMQLDLIGPDDPLLEADLAWQVRAWGRWALAQARTALASCYPTYAEFVPLTPGADYAAQPPRLLEADRAGEPHLDPLNAEFGAGYLGDPRNPRWVAKPAVAYLHARTVTCGRCRAVLPLLKTRWLRKNERRRVLLTIAPDAARQGVVFGVQEAVAQHGANAAQRREHDRRIGAGTMSRAGAACPCCGTIMTMQSIRLEGRAGRLGSVMTAVVVDGPNGKEFRLPTAHERAAAEVTEEQLRAVYAEIPYGLPEAPTPKAGSAGARRR